MSSRHCMRERGRHMNVYLSMSTYQCLQDMEDIDRYQKNLPINVFKTLYKRERERRHMLKTLVEDEFGFKYWRFLDCMSINIFPNWVSMQSCLNYCLF